MTPMLDIAPAHRSMVPHALRIPAEARPASVDWWPDETIVQVMKLRVADRASERYSRLRALWVRVIIRAAFDMVSHRDDRKLTCRKWADDAERWLFGKSYLFNSFESICGMLDINPERFRTWARGLTKDEVRKMEHMERTSSSIQPVSDDEVYGAFHRTFRR